MAKQYDLENEPEEILETSKSKSVLFSLLQNMKTRRGEGKKKGEVSPDEDELGNSRQNESSKERVVSKKTAVSAAPPLPLIDYYKRFFRTNSDPVLADFLAPGTTQEEEHAQQLQRLSAEVQSQLAKSYVNADEEPVPVDSLVMATISSDGLWAWCFVLPPLDGGAEPTDRDIRAALAANQITVGLMEESIQKLVRDKMYLCLCPVAHGTPPQDGENGWMEEVIPITAGKPHLEEQQAAVDFKNLNWLIPVNTGDVLCKIFHPTPAIEGTTVTGAPIRGKDGTRVALPVGSNTALNENGTALLAKVDGQVFYENGKYKVNPMVNIDGDVDLSTGNVKANGNVHIKGNIREGFIVQASGDINVEGMVEGATVIAGKNIFIKMGMNGNSHGSMDAGGDIKCRYLENAIARATGSVYMGSIINSTVTSDNEVAVLSDRGVIIGGTISALCRIKAKVIGNQMGHVTTLNLGRTPHFLMEKDRITRELEQVTNDVNDVESQLDDLYVGEEEIPVALQKMLQLKLPVLRMKQANLQKDLNEIHLKEEQLSNCQITAETVYPVAQVSFGKVVRSINDVNQHCRIYRNEGEVVIGSL